MFKKLVLIFIVLIAIIVGAVVIFAATFDANDYKKEITSLVKKQTGRDLNINGELKLAVYPDVAIEMGKTSLANAQGFSGTEFATINSGRVSVKLLPLLKKKIEADAITLDGLKLNLHRKADGSSNWDDLSKSKSNSASESIQAKEPSKVVEEMVQNLSIAGVSLKNANIIWRDDQAKQQYTLSPLNLTTGKYSQGKPLPVELSVVVIQKTPQMKITAEGSTTVSISNNNKNFSLSKLDLDTKLIGAQIPNGSLEARVSGNIKGNPQKINVSDLSLISTLTGDLVPQGALKTNVTGNVDFDVNAQQLKISGMKVDGTVNGQALDGGTLNALITGDTSFNLKTQQLSIPNLALDAKLAEGFVKGGSATAKINGNAQFDLAKQLLYINGMKAVANANGDLFQGGKATSNINGDLQLDLAGSQVKSPKITLNSQVEGGLVPGGKLTQSGSGNIDLNWGARKGSVNLSNVLVNLADLEVKGSNVQLQPFAEKPAITGQFQTNTFNLKSMMKTLGIEAPVTKNPAALSKVQAQFSLKGDTDKVDLQGLKAKLDNSQLSGNLAISNFTAPNIQTKLTVNSINLDDYLAPESKGAKQQSSGAAKSSGDKELLPLDTLRKLNIDGDFKISNMVINKIKMSNINAKVNAKQGLIVVNPANAQLYSGKYKGQITLNAKQALPTMKMRHELTGMRSEGLLFDLFQDKYISGGTKLTTELSSTGNSIDALLKNLNGTTSLGLNDGTIRDSSLAEKVSLAVKAFEKKDIEDGKSVVKFTGLSGDFKTTNGVFATKNLNLSSPYFNISGTGTANVASQKLDLSLRIGPKKQNAKRPLFAPLRITGTFSDPKFSLDLKDLLKALAAQDLEELKLKAEQKIAEEKAALKLKLGKEKQALQLKLANEEKALKLKLANEKAQQEQKLKQQLQKAKDDAVKKLQNKTGNLLNENLVDKLTGKKPATPADGEAPAEPPKSVEDQVKDKLKDKLKSFF